MLELGRCCGFLWCTRFLLLLICIWVGVVAFCQVSLISSRWFHPIVSVIVVGSPFSGWACRVAFPPTFRVSKGCISRTQVRTGSFLAHRVESSVFISKNQVFGLKLWNFSTLCSNSLECSCILFFKTWTSYRSSWLYVEVLLSQAVCNLVTWLCNSAIWAWNSVSTGVIEGFS